MPAKRSKNSKTIPAADSDVTVVSAAGAMSAATSPAAGKKTRKPRAKAPAGERTKPVAAKPAPGAEQPYPYEEIARLAYSLWEQRGRVPGSPLEDWLRAEKEILSR